MEKCELLIEALINIGAGTTDDTLPRFGQAPREALMEYAQKTLDEYDKLASKQGKDDKNGQPIQPDPNPDNHAANRTR